MILAIDTSTAACTAALFDGAGNCIDSREEVIGRGHSERLVPMLADLLGGRRPGCLLIGIGPGSFTGIRVGIAAAHGMAIGWGIEVAGMSSLALLAAGAEGPVAAAVRGGHGELFVQQFDRLADPAPMLNLAPPEAAAAITAHRVVGSGAAQLVEARGWGEAIDRNPSAADALLLPVPLRDLAPAPLYARAPDAAAEGGGMTMAQPRPSLLSVRSGGAADLDDVMRIMDRAFDSAFGEAWTRSQCAGILPMTGVVLLIAQEQGRPVGFGLHRVIADEAELLLLAVDPDFHRRGIGSNLLAQFIASSAREGATRLHLEVRENNPAVAMYRATGFTIVGRRCNYYTGARGESYDALTLARPAQQIR